MIKRILMAAIAATAAFIPVKAEVQPGTFSLIETLQANGVLVTFNHDDCRTNGSHGQYRWSGMKREMRLCPGDEVTGVDHRTVRHEVIHAIQHCVNVARGTHYDTPIITDEHKLANLVAANLPERTVDFIFENYDESQWLTELEAFAGAEHYTAAELEELFLAACVADG
jgi:hypothetical protein